MRHRRRETVSPVGYRAVIPSETLAPAFDALGECDLVLAKLEAGCCDPGRSPRMSALAETLAEARAGLVRLSHDPDSAPATLVHLEDAGAQLGRLQVGCCAPKRLPLYATMLENLTTAQLAINHALGTGH